MIKAVRMHCVMLLLLVVSVGFVGCQIPYHTRQSALLGGLTGAGMGAALGSAQGKTGAGAVIGSAVGAATGAALGREIDRAEARCVGEQLAAETEASANASSLAEIIEMSAAGLSDEVIVAHLGERGLCEQLEPGDLIAMKQEGISDTVIKTAQTISNRRIGGAGSRGHVIFDQPSAVAVLPASQSWIDSAEHRLPRSQVTWGVAFGD